MRRVHVFVAIIAAAAFTQAVGATRSTDAARYGNPAWSPDGKVIAFTSDLADPGHVTDVYLMKTEGNGLRRIAEGGAEPAWSPDGTRIVFTRTRVPRCTGPLAQCIDLAVVGLRADPGALPDVERAFRPGRVRLVANTEGGYAAAWSPGGRWIAFETGDEGADSAILAVHPGGSFTREVTCVRRRFADCDSDAEPTWSPDGERLAFSVGGSDFSSPVPGIGIVSKFGGPITKVAAGHEFRKPAWSPDGRSLACVELTNRGHYISVLDVGTGTLRQLHGPGWPWSPSWSPDGRQIAFEENGAIYVMKADGSDVRRLIG
jgi:TolB protein